MYNLCPRLILRALKLFKMKVSYINTANRTYLITFHNNTNKFICNSSASVIKCLKEQDKHKALKSIKVFDADKEKFVRKSKDVLKSFLVWDAESTDFFDRNYYLK